MSNVFATTRPQGPGQIAVPVNLTGTINDPPPGLEKLESGDLLRGTVLGQDKHGRLLVRTHLGVLHISTQQSLPEGTEVTLQLRHAGARLHVLILLSGAIGKEHAPQQAATGANAPSREATADSVFLGQRAQAIVVAPGPAPLPGFQETIQPGTIFNVRVVSIGSPTGDGNSATGQISLVAGKRNVAGQHTAGLRLRRRSLDGCGV